MSVNTDRSEKCTEKAKNEAKTRIPIQKRRDIAKPRRQPRSSSDSTDGPHTGVLMPFVDILTFRHPDGGSNVLQSHCSILPYLHLRHTSQPDQVSFPELEEVDCPKHPSDQDWSVPGVEMQ